ncbi:MAG: hypothetical protein RBQ66_05255 [Candidatus Cloacimonadaceae bacterium]|jgi:hypothetical protein|nr:hypothetical protein [Candidatus Cloacimonadaceae bacterium]
MNNKSSKLLAIITLLAIAALVVTGCGKSGNRFDNRLPVISISSYEGWNDDFVPAIVDTSSHEYLFQQSVYWNASDPDGVVTGFAFRVLDENMNPIITPGYEYTSRIEDNLIPDVILNSNSLLGSSKEGWVIHYKSGATQEYPLDDPRASRTIWTSQKYAVINFPAADSLGNPDSRISFFEVIAIDNRGDIVAKSAWRKLRAQSNIPECFLTTTKGNPEGEDVGTGIILKFTMKERNPFITSDAKSFSFRIQKINELTNEIESQTDWIYTDSDNDPSMDEFLITAKTNPPLEPDYTEDGTFLGTITRVVGRAENLAGVYSDENEETEGGVRVSTVEFKVKPGFKPRTLLYHKKIYGLGDYHFEDYNDINNNVDPAPSFLSGGGIKYGTGLFRENLETDDGLQTVYSVVYSSNLKVYLRWGWWGEYVKDNGEYFTHVDADNSYFDKKADVVLSDNSSSSSPVNYYSEITHFHLRYDNEPFYFPAFSDPEYFVTDDDGTTWLRVPVSSPLRQSIVLTSDNLSPGLHRFEVRCEDTQEEYSDEPAVLDLYVHPSTPPSQRQGILVVDDDIDHVRYSPETDVDEIYANMVSGLGLSADQVQYVDYNGNDSTPLPEDFRKRRLSYGLLQNYKLVLYHSDNPNGVGNLKFDIDALTLYLRNGGNLMISHSNRFRENIEGISIKLRNSETDGYLTPTILLDAMGIPRDPQFSELGAINTHSFMIEANGQQDFPDINLRYTDEDLTEVWINPAVKNYQGLSAVAYFNEEDGIPQHHGESIYTLGCKPVDYPVFPPNQEQYDQYSGRTIGMRKVNDNNFLNSRSYLFTFPLSYMELEDSKNLLIKVWNELQ